MSIKTKSVIAVAAMLALSVGYWASNIYNNTTATAADKKLAEARKNFSPIQGAIISPARKIGIPALIKDNGETLTLNDLTGNWHFLFFGYTNCPDICPVTMGVVAQAKKEAEAANQVFPEVFFISVDPDRDKIKALAEYVQYFDKDFVGVTGDKNLLKALTLQLSVVYMDTPADKATGDYAVDHSSALLLINPEGKLQAFFNPPHNPKTILKDFQTVLNIKN
ncbi:Cytochrome oxidase biogenesis protein Sco1/SenC/PrrC, thiol-disulfide reductase involved in Cu(I) insertion into CoxII Cu(A) center [hydrothermal vent metagenome]|uniref:Cytochrome oxidase biogenesis protein Sco1/SenC/PrrC, thiol-disulfide reductase involved in Cu(I) insertion into CoxII Cu(A) center n=1 Tax=hydrothermal vent metagenome TaxID=652676 RepID=A0A3B0W913_9ZZZZ